MNEKQSKTAQIDRPVSRRKIIGGIGAVGILSAASLSMSARASALSSKSQPNDFPPSGIKWIDTIVGVGLENHTPETIGANLIVAKGYKTVGDEGGGLYIWTPTHPTEETRAFSVGGTGGEWVRVESEEKWVLRPVWGSSWS